MFINSTKWTLVLSFIMLVFTHSNVSADSLRNQTQDLEVLVTELKSGKQIMYQKDHTEATSVSFVDIFTDAKGHKYVLKQYRPRHPYEDNLGFKEKPSYKLVVEYVASRIAEESDVPMNRVRVLPSDVPFDLKKCYYFPANLHTFIEGEIRDTGIQQDNGLTYAVIQNMVKHPQDLARIAAFDLFVSNPDRNNSNLFYSKSKDQFIGIDLGECFYDAKIFLEIPTPNLVNASIASLSEIQEKGTRLTAQEINGLRIYRNTLAQFAKNYPIEKINRYLDEAKAMSGLTHLDPCLCISYEQKVKQVIKENLLAINPLLHKIDELLCKS